MVPKAFIACAVIVDDHGRFLLIKRAREPFIGHWGFISGVGASLKGLIPELSVIDEVNYDIGADFDGEFAFSYTIKDSEVSETVHVFVGKVNAKDIVLNTEAATEYGWFSRGEIEQVSPLAFNNEWILQKLSTDLPHIFVSR